MSLKNTNLIIQMSQLPPTFVDSPQRFSEEMVRRMRIVSPSGTNFIFIGDTEPGSNVGPWLKGGTQWWVFDESTKKYIPLDISASDEDSTSLWNFGSDTPPEGNRDKPWFRTVPGGQPDRLYAFDSASGFWLAKHSQPPGAVMMFLGAEADITTFDEGENASVTDKTGPIWEKVTQLSARFPIGAGTLPSGTVVAPGSVGGEEKHQLTEGELAKHQHFIANNDVNTDVSGAPTLSATNTLEKEYFIGADPAYSAKGSSTAATLGKSSFTGNDEGHNTIPPYYALFFLRRTARLYYRQNG